MNYNWLESGFEVVGPNKMCWGRDLITCEVSGGGVTGQLGDSQYHRVIWGHGYFAEVWESQRVFCGSQVRKTSADYP